MIKKALYIIALALCATACTEDYTNWETPVQNEAITPAVASFKVAGVANTIDLEGYAEETVQVMVPELSANVSVEGYTLTLIDGDNNYNLYPDPQGYVSVNDLKGAIKYLYGSKREEHTLTGKVSATGVVKGETGEAVISLNAKENVSFKAIMPVVKYSQYLWTPGNGNGWNHAGSDRLVSPELDGNYSGYVYIDGEYKLTTAPDWDHTNYGGSFDAISETGGNFWAEAGVYLMKVDLEAGNATATKVEFGVIGDATPGGWDSDTDMEYDVAEGCWVAEMTLTDGTIKFRANDDWAINYGGAHDNLVPGGDNINVSAGDYLIKLYTGRRGDKANIYCEIIPAN